MQKLIVLGLALTLNSCGQSEGPALPVGSASGAADAVPGTSENYNGNSNIPQMNIPVGSSNSTPVTNTGSTMTGMVVGSNGSATRTENGPPELPGVDAGTKTDRSISFIDDSDRGIWEGFGTSLGWWANGVGKSNYEALYADLLFTAKDVKFVDDKAVPGLSLGIVRYNIGGSGQMGDGGAGSGLAELSDKAPSSSSAHDGFELYRDIDGFWKDSLSMDPSSTSFDWNRDINQRSMLSLAKRRGVSTFEFYSNAPMWWMTNEGSAAGGTVTPAQRSNAMLYLAMVTKVARTQWNIPVSSLEPFNEPSSGKWKLSSFQQGSNLGLEEQAESLAYLKLHLAQQGASEVKIAAADESNPTLALANHEYMKNRKEEFQGIMVRGSDLYEKVNVHTSDDGVPFKDDSERMKLRASVGDKKIWVSDYSDTDTSGKTLAQSFFADMNTLKPTAWLYFQAAEPYSKKGLVTGDFHMMQDGSSRGKPKSVANKYYVMAQFSRFIRPGQAILDGGDESSVVALDRGGKRLSFVTLNASDKEQTITLDLSELATWNQTATLAVTRVDGSKQFVASAVKITKKRVSLTLEPGSVTSLEIYDVLFN